jgi:hypothetical protein
MGALTLDTLADKLHDMSPTAMRGRASERMPNIFDSSMGGNPMSDFSFLGFLTQLFAGFNSAVANADPADITGPEDLPGLLVNFIEDLPIIGDFIALVESMISGDFDPADVVTAVENAFSTLASMLGLGLPDFIFAPIREIMDVLDFSSPEAFFGSVVDALLALPGLLFGGGFDLISPGAIGNFFPNLLANPLFKTPTSLLGGDLWSWDDTQGQTVPGTAKTTADGTEHSLWSNPIAVAPGQQLSLSVWTKWSGLVSTGAPIALMAETYDAAGASMTTPVVDTVSSPGSAGGWTELSGDYTVPAGAATARLRLNVDATATAGMVWFDNGSVTKPALISQNLIGGLVGDLAEKAMQGDFLGLLSNLGAGSPTLAAITNRFANMGAGGLFNSAGLTNVAGMPLLPADRIPDLISGFATMFDSWFGGSTAAGTPAEVTTTIASIRTAVQGGYTLQTFTASNSSWSVPSSLRTCVEAYAGVVGGGGKGDQGGSTTNSTSPADGGVGGSSGGYKLERFDTATLGSTLNITIGAAASTAGANGGVTSVKNGATTLAASTPDSSGIATPQGYALSSSMPGSGGSGGGAQYGTYNNDGVAGESSAAGVGGAPGAGSTGSGAGNAGSAGASGQTSTTPIAGGGGGGGGGGRRTTNNLTACSGGAGGNGGYPGGGSGGGGAACTAGGQSATGGAPGTPANGFAFLLWKG